MGIMVLKIVYPMSCHRYTALLPGVEDQKQKILEKVYPKKQSSKYSTVITFHTTFISVSHHKAIAYK
jgi:hypothetical protein